MTTIDPSSIEALADLVSGTQHCDAVHVQSVRVTETFQSETVWETVWEGVVEVLDLPDHPDLGRCYAWYEPGGKSWVVAHVPPWTPHWKRFEPPLLGGLKIRTIPVSRV